MYHHMEVKKSAEDLYFLMDLRITVANNYPISITFSGLPLGEILKLNDFWQLEVNKVVEKLSR